MTRLNLICLNLIRPKFVILVGLALFPALSADSATHTLPDATAVSKICYAKVGPVLQRAGGKFTPEVRNAYLDWAEKTVLEELREGNQTVPESCLTDIRRDDTARDAIFGSMFPPDPSILQNYAQLRAQLGEKILAKYRSFVVAVSVARRIKRVETAAEVKNIGRDYQPGFWVDESLHVPGSEPEKQFVRQIAAFMKQSQISAADLYQNASLQAQLKADLAKNAVSAGFIGEVGKSVQFGERLKYAMVLLGQRPAGRDPKPGMVEWMRHLIAINSTTPKSTPTADGRPMPWPLFPLDSAPWPLLMPLSHPVPMNEAEYIWEAFEGMNGADRYHTYGPYRGDADVMPDSLRPSTWFWDAWPDEIVHGGMCVPISKATVELYSALGKPAMWAGQPGHANLISFQYVNKVWTAEIEQAFAGGPDVTCAQWYFDEDEGTQIHYRGDYNWAWSEYHLGLAVAMNIGLKSYVDTRIAANLFRTMPAPDRQTLGLKLLQSALEINPYNPELWYRLGENTVDPVQAAALGDAVWKRDPALASDPDSNVSHAKPLQVGPADQYWNAIAPLTVQSAARNCVFNRPAPAKEEDRRRVFLFLKTVPGLTIDDDAVYVEKFTDGRPSEAPAEALAYDQKLAAAKDTYGLVRMYQRYRDGDGVPQNEEKAIEWISRAAALGDAAGASILGSLYPSVPRDQISVVASSVFGQDQTVQHLVDGSGLYGADHDNDGGAKTMWQSGTAPTPRPPAPGLAPSPAWARFDFVKPTKFDSILIWNHNQWSLTNRGFRRTRIYGSNDGKTWTPVTAQSVIELPRAGGNTSQLPVMVAADPPGKAFKSVIIAAEAVGGNYGGDCYGLSAVRFGIRRLTHTIPAKAITVTTSSVYTATQAAQHLVDGSGMAGVLHASSVYGETMWHTVERPGAQPPVTGLPASPAWVRFDFAAPQEVDRILIWNLNQLNYTDRGFRKFHIYVTSDGAKWHPLSSSEMLELPRADGVSPLEPTAVPVSPSETTFKSVIIAADAVDGNYGGSIFGLSAVRFVVRH